MHLTATATELLASKKDHMPGETNLHKILSRMRVIRNEDNVVFATIPHDQATNVERFSPVCTFRESEGLTLVIPEKLSNGFPYEKSVPMAWLTIDVHTDLEAVGLTAALSAALTRENISCNVIAAYFHDHIFIPVANADRAISAIEALKN